MSSDKGSDGNSGNNQRGWLNRLFSSGTDHQNAEGHQFSKENSHFTSSSTSTTCQPSTSDPKLMECVRRVSHYKNGQTETTEEEFTEPMPSLSVYAPSIPLSVFPSRGMVDLRSLFSFDDEYVFFGETTEQKRNRDGRGWMPQGKRTREHTRPMHNNHAGERKADGRLFSDLEIHEC